MENTDTIKLLKECDAGTKMAVAAIDEVLDKVDSKELANLLSESKKHHEKYGNELHAALNSYDADEKEPNPIAKSMSWMKINLKTGMDESDSVIADLITDGCNMGIKSLHKYFNQYKAANEQAKKLCHDLIAIEDELLEDLRCYL